MITYLAIRLTNGDYYWGSTSMSLKRREQFHRSQDSNDHFHNSLRKYPEDWVFLEIFYDSYTDRTTEKKMLDLHHGNSGCLNISNEPQGWGSGANHARNKNPEYWEHLKGEGHPRVKDPSKWVNAVGDNHWTKSADIETLKALASNFPPPAWGNDNGMRKPEVAKKVSRWRQGRNVEAWLQADVIRNAWLQADQPKVTAKALAKATSFSHSKLRTMVALFLEGWDPLEDEEWLSWKASVVP
jgi:hypothetical protein